MHDKPARYVPMTQHQPYVRTTGRPCIISRPPHPTASPQTRFGLAALYMIFGTLVVCLLIGWPQLFDGLQSLL